MFGTVVSRRLRGLAATQDSMNLQLLKPAGLGLILVLIRPYGFGAPITVAMTRDVRQAEEVTPENSRQERHGQHKRHNGPLGEM